METVKREVMSLLVASMDDTGPLHMRGYGRTFVQWHLKPELIGEDAPRGELVRVINDYVPDILPHRYVFAKPVCVLATGSNVIVSQSGDDHVAVLSAAELMASTPASSSMVNPEVFWAAHEPRELAVDRDHIIVSTAENGMWSAALGYPWQSHADFPRKPYRRIATSPTPGTVYWLADHGIAELKWEHLNWLTAPVSSIWHLEMYNREIGSIMRFGRKHPEAVVFNRSGTEMFMYDSTHEEINVFSRKPYHFWPKCFKCPVAPASRNGSGNVALAVTPSGEHLLVLDSLLNTVQVYRRDGVFVRQWGCRGSGPGEFFNPHGICVLDNGIVVVADTFNHRLQLFR